MKRKRLILCLLLVALMWGCGKPEIPPNTPTVPATYEEAVIPGESQIPSETDAGLPVTENTVSTVPTTAAIPEITTVLPTVPPPTQGATPCAHNYLQSLYLAPTCEQAGYQNYRCEKCGDVQQQFSLPLGHSYSDATCHTPKSCTRCALVEGIPLGHSYTSGLCSRCGEKDPALRIITIQVKDSKNAPVDGVTVELRIAGARYGTAVSTGGQVSFTLENHIGSYQLVLTEIPVGYKARKDSYTYRSDTGAIVLDPVPVVSPEDHSQAAYKVGSTMEDFTVTDVDGNTYSLPRLLQENKLVILNFWYTTCEPCKAEFPYFNRIYQRYHEDIEVLALNHFDTEAQIRQLRSEMGLEFPLISEHLGMQQGFGIQSYPVTVFIGPQGRVLHIQRDIGFQSEEELDTLVRQMIGK